MSRKTGSRYSKKKSSTRRNTKKFNKTTNVKGVASQPVNYQIINKTKPPIYRFKDTFQLNDIVGANGAIQGLNTFQISQLARYNSLVSMFRQYRITNLKLRWRLQNIDTTDGNQLPTIYMRYNYDPELVTAVLSENYFLRQQNVICKQFHHNTITGSLLTYNIKPAVMRASQLYNSTSFVPVPTFNTWQDMDPAGTVDEVNHYGLQYFITNLPAGTNLNLDCEMSYECRDVV